MRISEKEQIALEKMFTPIDRMQLEVARISFPENINEKLGSLEKNMDKDFDSIAENICLIDPTLVKSIQKDKGKVLHTIISIRERAIRAHKANLNLKSNRLASVSYFLIPDNGPQERWFGIDAVISVLNGNRFDELIALTSPEEEYHRPVLPKNP